MQQHHVVVMGTEKYAGNPTAIQVCSDLPKSFSTFQGSAKGHADGPAKFGRANIDTDRLAVFLGQRQQPITNRHISCFCFKKSSR